MQAILYKIANWEQSFETCETKKLTHLKWVPVPNKHDGLGFRRVAAQKNCCELFAAWNLILQVASKGRKDTERGQLKRQGRPLTSEDLAMMTGFPSRIFDSALTFFSSSDIGWLVVDNQPLGEPPDKTGGLPENSGESPAEGKEGIEGNGREDGAGGPHAAALTDEQWIELLKGKPAYQSIDIPREFSKMALWCEAHRKQPTRKRFLSWLNRIEKPMSAPTATHNPRNAHTSNKITEEYKDMFAKAAAAASGGFGK